MPYYPELKIVGRTSSYKSIQKSLNRLKKEKFNDQQLEIFLDNICLLCQILDENPDEIVAHGKSHWIETTDAFTDFLKNQNVGEDELDFRLSCVITFLGWNRAF